MVLMRGASSRARTEMGGSVSWCYDATPKKSLCKKRNNNKKKIKKRGINDYHKYFSELFECQEKYNFDSSSFTGWEPALVLTLWKVFCYDATNLHLFLRAGGHSNSWLCSLLIFVPYCTWTHKNYMKTVIWVSRLVQRKYQRLLKGSFEFVVHVHVN